MPPTFVVLVIAVSSLSHLRHFLRFLLPNVLQALDSDGEETPRGESAGASKSKKAADEGGLSKPAISEASSDGELVEIPDQELISQQKR